MGVSEKTIFNEYSRTCNTINLLTDSKVQYPNVGPGVWTNIALMCNFLKHLIIYFSLLKICCSFPFIRTFSIQFICLKKAWLSRFFHLFRLWYRQLLLIIWTSFKPTAISGSIPLLKLALHSATMLTVRDNLTRNKTFFLLGTRRTMSDLTDACDALFVTK